MEPALDIQVRIVENAGASETTLLAIVGRAPCPCPAGLSANVAAELVIAR